MIMATVRETHVCHEQMMLDVIKGLFNRPEFSDMCLVVGTRRYNLHKSIIFPQSVKMKELYNSAFAEEGNSIQSADRGDLYQAVQQVNHTQECISVLPDFLEYFYTAKVIINIRNVVPLLLLTYTYKVMSLALECRKFIRGYLASPQADVEVVFRWYTHKGLRNAEHHEWIGKECLQVIKQRLYDVIQCPDVWLRFSYQDILTFLKSSEVQVRDEYSLYRAVVDWISETCHGDGDETKARLTECLQYIRFPMMSTAQLANIQDTCMIFESHQDLYSSYFLAAYRYHNERNASRFWGHPSYEMRQYLTQPARPPVSEESHTFPPIIPPDRRGSSRGGGGGSSHNNATTYSWNENQHSNGSRSVRENRDSNTSVHLAQEDPNISSNRLYYGHNQNGHESSQGVSRSQNMNTESVARRQDIQSRESNTSDDSASYDQGVTTDGDANSGPNANQYRTPPQLSTSERDSGDTDPSMDQSSQGVSRSQNLNTESVARRQDIQSRESNASDDSASHDQEATLDDDANSGPNANQYRTPPQLSTSGRDSGDTDPSMDQSNLSEAEDTQATEEENNVTTSLDSAPIHDGNDNGAVGKQDDDIQSPNVEDEEDGSTVVHHPHQQEHLNHDDNGEMHHNGDGENHIDGCDNDLETDGQRENIHGEAGVHGYEEDSHNDEGDEDDMEGDDDDDDDDDHHGNGVIHSDRDASSNIDIGGVVDDSGNDKQPGVDDKQPHEDNNNAAVTHTRESSMGDTSGIDNNHQRMQISQQSQLDSPDHANNILQPIVSANSHNQTPEDSLQHSESGDIQSNDGDYQSQPNQPSQFHTFSFSLAQQETGQNDDSDV